MSLPSVSTSAAGDSRPPGATDTRLRGRWLLLARLGWLVVVISMLALFVGSLPAYYALIQTPCGSVAFPY